MGWQTLVELYQPHLWLITTKVTNRMRKNRKWIFDIKTGNGMIEKSESVATCAQIKNKKRINMITLRRKISALIANCWLFLTLFWLRLAIHIIYISQQTCTAEIVRNSRITITPIYFCTHWIRLKLVILGLTEILLLFIGE